MKPYEGTEAYKAGFEDGKPKWIMCTDRLPELPLCSAVEVDDMLTYYTSNEVLVCLKDGTIKIGFYEYEETSDKGGWDIDGIYYEVVAWMPLPEPYKEDE